MFGMRDYSSQAFCLLLQVDLFQGWIMTILALDTFDAQHSLHACTECSAQLDFKTCMSVADMSFCQELSKAQLCHTAHLMTSGYRTELMFSMPCSRKQSATMPSIKLLNLGFPPHTPSKSARYYLLGLCTGTRSGKQRLTSMHGQSLGVGGVAAHLVGIATVHAVTDISQEVVLTYLLWTNLLHNHS